MSQTLTTNEPRTSRTIFALLFIIPIFAVLLYGSTDVSALIPLAILTTILAGSWIGRGWRSGAFELNLDAIQLPLLGLLLLGLVQLLPLGDAGIQPGVLSVSPSNALSIDPFWTRIFLVRLVGYTIFFAAALTFIDTEGRYRRALTVILIFGGVIAFIGVLQKLTSPDAIYGVRKHTGAIPFGPYINSHHFASLMVLISGMAIAHLLGSGISKQIKLLVAISAAVMAIAVPFTSSRGGVIAYIAMLSVAVLAWFYRGKEKEARSWAPILAGGSGLALIVVGSIVYLGGEASLLRGFGVQNATDDISSGRFHFWSVAWQIFLANPILGTGFDSFAMAFTKFDTQSGMFRVEQAHNDYLQMLSDGGIPAFLITISFIILLVRKALKRIREESDDLVRTTVIGGLAGCVGIFVHSIFDFPLRTAGNAYVFLLVVALMFAPVAASVRRSSGRGRSRPSSRTEP
ncbi:MAG: O-antigen ligase family protein [bacterium]|nr:O-antigen ligase family protein [bacterium]